MKKIKLPASAIDTIISEEQARSIIADLQAQLDAQEPVEFWEGQLVEGYNGVLKEWTGPYTFEHNSTGVMRLRDGDGTIHCFSKCRPLQDPLIDQYKPLAPYELLPDRHGEYVNLKFGDGRVESVHVRKFNRFRANYREAIGWMPADGWGRSE